MEKSNLELMMEIAERRPVLRKLLQEARDAADQVPIGAVKSYMVICPKCFTEYSSKQELTNRGWVLISQPHCS